ncbi:MAG: PEP-CTERM sorting domain-containing protein [Verrucomicrobiota bacterium]
MKNPFWIALLTACALGQGIASADYTGTTTLDSGSLIVSSSGNSTGTDTNGTSNGGGAVIIAMPTNPNPSGGVFLNPGDLQFYQGGNLGNLSLVGSIPETSGLEISQTDAISAPEPSTCALLLLGGGLLAWSAGRARRLG